MDTATPTTASLIETFGEPDDIASDPSGPSNLDRISWVQGPTEDFANVCYHYGESEGVSPLEREDITTIVGDMIGDLLHLVTALGGDPEAAYESAWSHFTAEVGMGYDE